ncbi:Sigma-X negative effector [Bacillus subtilis subsp. subtilis]|nr:Sigma-X negative effector [Bacillus subtilis]ARW32027.1 Sigma-X negative effector [Bacillus subtilis subsp. subtilis]
MKSEWNEEQIKELLSQLPAVKDHRSPQDIYKRLTMAKRKNPLSGGLAPRVPLQLRFISPSLFLLISLIRHSLNKKKRPKRTQ